MLADRLEELRELGLRGTAFRVGWELRTRTGLAGRLAKAPPLAPRDARWTARLPFADPVAVAGVMRPRIPEDELRRLRTAARSALTGKILAFSRWVADYGAPIDWFVNPTNGERWPADAWWSVALADEPRVGDVKLTWEIARFPHAFHLARAAAFFPQDAEASAVGLVAQMASFVDANPRGHGPHWNSGQEVAIRLLAWLFALDALIGRTSARDIAVPLVADAVLAGAAHVREHFDYARIAVYNNHVLAEALLLYVAGSLFPEIAEARAWRDLGRDVLTEQAIRQFRDDGSYLMDSHNYHRTALQYLLWASVYARSTGDRPDETWTSALARSVDFLVAFQEPTSGWLPNFGGNDGSRPAPLATCAFPDFRPTLQAASILARGERPYPPGPWDEEAAWWLGAPALDVPLREPARASASFPSGLRVLRSPSATVAVRCGDVTDRFGQIDMLHADVWWRGHDVVVDPGSYLYNGPAEWHEHFMTTASHSTVTVDGLDQMLHFRRFKTLYPTRAELTSFAPGASGGRLEGVSHAYERTAGVTHRRTVELSGDRIVVVDEIDGEGEHDVRLHWLGGDFPWKNDGGRLVLDTPSGRFAIEVTDGDERLPATVVAGQESPPRGWLSRYFAEKTPVPSMVVERRVRLPVRWTTTMGTADSRTKA